MLSEGSVAAIDGTQVPLAADTICVHGDTPGAIDVVKRLRHALGEAGVAVQSL
jgi:UPF0271 protein